MPKKNHKYQDQIRGDWKKHRTQPVPATGEHVKVRISFQNARPGEDFCLSHCEENDVRQAMDCFKRLTSLTWIQVLQTSTKNPSDKTGLHWTVYDDDALNFARPNHVSVDHTFVGIRAGEKFRIFGFRFGPYFYVIWFDPEHKICEG